MEHTPRRRRSAWRGVLIGALALVALWGLLGGLVLPYVAKKLVAEKGSEQLGRPVSVEKISFNPYTLDATLEGFRILEADQKTPFATFDRLDVEGSATSFYRLAPVIDRVTLTGLDVRLIRDAENHYNVTDIVERFRVAAKASAEKARAEQARTQEDPDDSPARFSVSNIRLVGARVDFDDRPVGRKHEIADIHVSVPFVSTLPRHLKEYVEPSIAANINGAPLLVTGETLPFGETLQTRFTLNLSALDIRRYLPYVPTPLPVTVDSGTLDANLVVGFSQGAKRAPSIEATGTAALRDVALSRDNGKLLRFTRLETRLDALDPVAGRARVGSVILEGVSGLDDDVKIARAEASGIEADLKTRSVRVASVTTSDGELHVRRARDGSIELPRLPTASEPATDAPAAPWKVAVEKVNVSGYRVDLADEAVRPAARHRVTLTSLDATGLTTEEGGRGKAAARLALERNGAVDVDADFRIEPFEFTARVDARGVDLVPLRPYMNQFKTVALKSGAASAKGQVAVKQERKGLRIAYRGNAEVSRFAAFDTTAREDLLSFKSIRTSGVDFAFAPDAPIALAVGDIVVDRVYSRLIVHPDGKLNLQQLRTATPEEPDAPAQAEADSRPRNVRIDRIAFVDGRLNFTDHFIRPNYTADVGELQGTVTGLTSAPESRATVDLKGRWDGASPVTIAGTVNPLRGDLFADIAAKGKDIELPKLSAYSQRYAGYGIKEGRLTLDVKYHVEDGKLDGRNNITLDRLTFGDKVESPEATKLPVIFAVNLLKDADGRIALQLPIKGSLEDPQFEIGAVVTQVLGSILKKAVTSPFSLLAAAFGGAEGKAGASSQDLAWVDFAPGRSELDAADLKKLETMARAMKGRPGLTLVMAPRIDERDAEALRYAELQKIIATDGKAPDDAAYAAAVRAAYAKAKLPGEPRDLSVAAMETALMSKATVGDAELHALAKMRAQKVRAWLVEKGELPAERLVLAGDAGGEAPAGAPKSARLDFALR